jgi:hypothetical protein
MSERRTNYLCNLERTEELNERIFDRNRPLTYFNPVFEQRSQSTKYQKYPITKPIENDSIKMGYKTKWSEFASNVNSESVLRNQIYPRSNSTSSQYIPSSSSDLYNRQFIEKQNEIQAFPYLFEQSKFNNTELGDLGKLGRDNFYNHTRQQLKNM